MQQRTERENAVGVCELLCSSDHFEADSEVISRTDDNISATAELMSVYFGYIVQAAMGKFPSQNMKPSWLSSN